MLGKFFIRFHHAAKVVLRSVLWFHSVLLRTIGTTKRLTPTLVTSLLVERCTCGLAWATCALAAAIPTRLFALHGQVTARKKCKGRES